LVVSAVNEDGIDILRESSAGVNRLRFMDGTSESGSLAFSHTNSQWELVGRTGIAIQMFTNGFKAMKIDTTGNVGIGTTTPTAKLEIDGNLFLNGDNDKIYLGAGKDASITYNGTNIIINPKEVGSGIVDISGRLQTDGYNAVDGTSALAGTKVYYVSDTSGGSLTRKLTFKDGLLISET
jgi:hypothetical protein